MDALGFSWGSFGIGNNNALLLITMKKQKPKTFTERTRENPFILSTILLGVIVLILLVGYSVRTIPSTNEKVSLQSLCERIEGTPTWINASNGKVMAIGFVPNITSKIVKEELIPNNIAFFYHPACHYCQEEIKLFRDSWKDYQDSGLAVDCSK